jgi:hypothetical protein
MQTEKDLEFISRHEIVGIHENNNIIIYNKVLKTEFPTVPIGKLFSALNEMQKDQMMTFEQTDKLWQYLFKGQ